MQLRVSAMQHQRAISVHFLLIAPFQKFRGKRWVVQHKASGGLRHAGGDLPGIYSVVYCNSTKMFETK